MGEGTEKTPWRQHVILGVRVHDLPTATLNAVLEAWLIGDVARMIVTPNPEFIVGAERDVEFKHLLNRADLALPDGIGLRFAVAALSEEKLLHRHTGADTLITLAELCAKRRKRLVLMGGSPRKTERAATTLRKRFPGLDIAVFDPGIIDEHQVRLSEATLAGIERLSPQAVAVALGQGKQERVMEILKQKIPSVRILMGIGGAADYVSEAVKRAPTAWQRLGFEWLWRLVQEPWRSRRILTAIIAFPVRVAWVTLRSGRFLSATRRVLHELRQHFSRSVQSTSFVNIETSSIPELMSVRTRIAPSPTGYMHIGTLRTVMFDYFMARQSGGQFVVRIEDTDQARLVPGALESLLKTFQKLGIDYDEGPVLQADGSITEVGDYGPYVQSKRLDIYKPYADQLVKDGHAYVCFCTRERLDEMRAAQTAAKQTPKYDRLCLKLAAEEVARRLAAGESHVIRLKIPDGEVSFDDAIRGVIKFNLADVDDQVIMKSDGFASYHLAVVVDDHLMKITHVLRGEEWISSTPKQIVLHSMLGWAMPVYAHVPLILNPDRTKLSKRKGDVSVEGYLNKGYLPEAIINFISTLGFNPTSDQEIFTRDELVKLFDLSKVNKGGAVMNTEKLDWMNHQYLSKLSPEALIEVAKPFITSDISNERVRKAILVERERTNRLDEFEAKLAPYLVAAPYEASILVWKKTDAADALQQLQGVRSVIAGFSAETFTQIALLEAAVKEYIVGAGLSNGNVLWPLRVALSGAEKSASPFECLWVLGQTESLSRIDAAITRLQTS
ncbi:MAG: glutamyl-tRNA synthetase [Patescibacteria group bacterium]|jgi:glutamyl-tRNA synthetase|nr:glutamyl-tRNA synthetase [Patescibacteria group bacterium]